jgi:serine/threonine-protein kinase
MLFTADEIAAGDIPHAIRFILPNARIRGGGVYARPATHTTGATSGGSDAPPYGVRFRLKSTFDPMTLPSDGARVVAKAMQTYGMILSDGGNIALTAADDRFTTHKWSDIAVDSHSLSGIAVTDFEVVDMGSTVAAGDCVRNP